MPVIEPPLALVAAVNTRTGASCALQPSGTVLCWGNNQYGELGNGAEGAAWTPSPVLDLATAFDLAGTSIYHVKCAVRDDGTSRCWGDGASIPGSTEGPQRSVVAMDRWPPLNDLDMANVQGLAHFTLVDRQGQVWTDAEGVLAQIDGLPGPAISATAECALLASGQVACWSRGGGPACGNLGNGSSGHSATAQLVRDLTEVVELVGHNDHTTRAYCARRADGTVWCWGCNARGRLGDGTQTDRSLPVQVIGLPEP